LALKKKA
jgi:hypothetical protein